jgi:hypothetical protein
VCCIHWGEWREDFIVVAFLLTSRIKKRVSAARRRPKQNSVGLNNPRGRQIPQSAHDRTPSKPRDDSPSGVPPTASATLSLSLRHTRPPTAMALDCPSASLALAGKRTADRREPRLASASTCCTVPFATAAPNVDSNEGRHLVVGRPRCSRHVNRQRRGHELSPKLGRG